MAQLRERVRSTRKPTETILLVDDDPNHRALFSRRLERTGYVVRTASGADEAIDALKADMPDAVVLDMAMPGRDGLSALQEMVALKPTLPIIIHTAYPSYRDNFLAWAADGYVEKSQDLQPLVAAIETALARHVTA